MGLLRTIAVFATLMPGVALAQSPLPQDIAPVNPEGVTDYCYYGGMLYSVGAHLCVPGNQGFTLVCKSQDEDKNASKSGHAVWRFDFGTPGAPATAATCGLPR